jgi:circadian clock protein KaiC
LRQLFVERSCTVLALADHPADVEGGQKPEVIFHPLCGVVIDLAQRPRAYGDVRRQVRVIKARGLPNSGGFHDMKIRTGGMDVFPRLGAYSKPEYSNFQVAPSGIEPLDHTIGGGLEYGTACLVVGPSGTGKSTLSSVFTVAAAERGDSTAIYLFDERPETYKARAEGIGIPMRRHVDAGRILLRQLDPAEIAPGEFAHLVCRDVEERGPRVVVIDSSGVLTILCGSQEGFMSIGKQAGVDISYLSDTILVLGYLEDAGCVRRFLTAVKRRQGEHETTIRELRITSAGVTLGAALTRFRGLVQTNGQPGEVDSDAR